MRSVYCSNLAPLPGFPGCCHSCHNDDDDGISYLCGGEGIHEGRDYDVCCAVSAWLRTMPVAPELPAED